MDITTHFYTSVDGWFNFKDIYDAVITDARDGAAFAEVGSWYGRSAAYMAVEIANSGKKIDFFCIDTWRGSDDLPWMAEHLAGKGGSAFPFFRENMQRGGVWHLIQPMEMPSVEAARRFPDESLDFVMIDGAHDYKSVCADVRAWLPKVKRGGLLAGDDANWPEVLIGVYETIPQSELTISNGGSNWSYRKQRPVRGQWTVRRSNTNGSDVFAYIPYVNRPDLLHCAVMSIKELWPWLVVIDQSADGLRPDELRSLDGIAGVFRAARSEMSFTQMMNWAQAEAYERQAAFLVFMHNDAECHGGVAHEVIDFARTQPRAGVVFTHYDAFSVFRTEALRSTGPWDETFRWYFSDIDYYRRLQLSGWETRDFGGTKVTHHTSQTLHADATIRSEVSAHAGWHEAHYRHKWGGRQGHERFTIPYDGKPW
jgi:hypothetical protein